MSIQQQQRVAVVTGASQGLGAGVVEGYRKLGYAVVAVSRTIAPSADPHVVTVQGDVADRATAERAVTAAVERFGRLDTLVNNAGIFIAKPFTDYTLDDYTAARGVNLDGFFHITQLAIAQMLEQGSGHVVTITTSLVDNADGRVPSVLASLTKGGLQSATKSLAIEYATRGIRVNAVSPGTIKTPMHPQENHQTLAALHPIGRMGEPSDITDAILFLENAPFITGEILHVDGGMSAGHRS
ncbi:SDR family NAD(P)-dependent oxidoreductase [Nonomuraea rubra]|uniref:NAD(P)-dependent dehydrogenase (Short-subunit alcohol dehydrogenase family) n=1 Tax=Nonomuraea rubra TaxID=46180 RepID=A0A7X0U1G6_9ACTN|nr:SDR family oxidoreductase [Nonomuraea rubra]MBB6551578.1 NAD(P)-dependent dehydrogenase (short-subunit alcohol dehydrogenase family) [Nonomuraea rubra]